MKIGQKKVLAVEVFWVVWSKSKKTISGRHLGKNMTDDFLTIQVFLKLTFTFLIDKWLALLSVTFLRKDQNIKQARLIREAFRKSGYFS